jgi:hypothetical protein
VELYQKNRMGCSNPYWRRKDLTLEIVLVSESYLLMALLEEELAAVYRMPHKNNKIWGRGRG